MRLATLLRLAAWAVHLILLVVHPLKLVRCAALELRMERADDVAAPVLINEPRRRELRVEAAAQRLSEASLVMVVPALVVVIHSTNVYHDGQRFDLRRVARAHNRRSGPAEARESAQQPNTQRLVGLEAPRVCADHHGTPPRPAPLTPLASTPG